MVKISYDELGTLYTNLQATRKEFDEASDRRSDLSQAIGSPFGRGELRGETSGFEKRWDDRRNKLNDALEQVAHQTEAILTGFGDFDLEAANQMAEEM